MYVLLLKLFICYIRRTRDYWVQLLNKRDSKLHVWEWPGRNLVITYISASKLPKIFSVTDPNIFLPWK